MISSRSISSSSSCCLSSSRRIIGMQGYVHTRHWCSLWIFMMHSCFWVLNKPVFFCGVCHGMSTNNLPTCFWEFLTNVFLRVPPAKESQAQTESIGDGQELKSMEHRLEDCGVLKEVWKLHADDTTNVSIQFQLSFLCFRLLMLNVWKVWTRELHGFD